MEFVYFESVLKGFTKTPIFTVTHFVLFVLKFFVPPSCLLCMATDLNMKLDRVSTVWNDSIAIKRHVTNLV